MVDEQNIIRYNTEHNIDKSINVVCFNNFEQMLFNLRKETLPQPDIAYNPKRLDELVEKKYLEVIGETKKFYYGEKYFLSLSRVNRPHRTLSAYELFHSEIFSNGVLSHDKIKNTKETIHLLHEQLPINAGITENDLSRFNFINLVSALFFLNVLGNFI